ncbi:MAG: Gfo/Idh/MocA family oxidoreductase [Candidatus Rokubacteria bacterium]|nr:Gfo/Idh/MocA family oxidoreductase [Candidatus Rokubacteria bacterium]
MRFLIAGLGSVGQRHVRNLRHLLGDDAEIFAWRVRGRDVVIDDRLNAEYGRRPEDAYRLARVLDLPAGLALSPDAVIVANPIAFHLDTARAAVAAGCHVFVEKPLADRWDGIPDLIASVHAQNLVGYVGYQMRFHPGLQRVKRWLEDGAIGDVVSASLHFGEYLPGAHPYEDYREGHTARRAEGGGVILALSHELDMAHWLFGMPTRVYAAGGHLSGLAIDVEDTATIVLECRVRGRLLPVHVHLDFVERPPHRFGCIVGEQGSIRWDHQDNTVACYEVSADRWRTESFLDVERNHLFLDEMRNFLRAIEGKEDPAIPLEEGAKALKVALAVRASLGNGRTTEVEA